MPWFPKAILFAVGALTLALFVVRPLREWAWRVNMRWLIAFHLIRFVGIYFLYLYARHLLPYGFAVVGGTGDIAIAALALIVMRFASYAPALIAWNVAGLADILGVAATAARTEMAVPGSMHELDHFPLVLLPTLIVPLVIVTHALMLIRAFQQRS